MQSLDHDVLKTTRDWLRAGKRPWLCTIVETIGSSPRPIGSMLSVLESGEQSGTVSGGCVEEELLEKLRSGAYRGDLPESVSYGLTAEENERFGLPCGGRLTLLIQKTSTDDSGWIQQSLAAIAERRCLERDVDLLSGNTRVRDVAQYFPLSYSTTRLQQCFGPRMRMLLIGAGQLAQSLSELALAMDYEVLVTDPRQNMLDQWLGPPLELIQGMPDDVIRERAFDSHSIIITLSHDPRIDDMALMGALDTQAWYIGALGSKRTTEKRIARLLELDMTQEQITRLHAPVGLSIGSKTPLEISVSIMAQLTQLRRENTGRD
tara:strand:- start:46609 stop:47568 length:960 start_codon:yes stop_codon:yes gene_type:complete